MAPNIKEAWSNIVHCCTRLSVGMSWDWVQGGDPLYAAVFSLSSCHGHIWPIWVNFFCKKRMTHILPRWRDKIGVQILFQPPQIGWFLRALSLFKNWGSFSKIGRGIFLQIKGQPSKLEKRPSLKVTGYFGAKTLWNWPKFFHTLLTYTTFTFCKKNGQNGQPSPQWCEENTTAYMGSPVVMHNAFFFFFFKTSTCLH